MGYIEPDIPPSPSPPICDIFKIMDACVNEKQGSLIESDEYLSGLFLEHPNLATFHDETGTLPIWASFIMGFHKTLKTIIQQDQTPRANDRFISRYSMKDGVKTPVFLTDTLDRILIRTNHPIYHAALKFAHLLIPVLCKADTAVLVEALLEEAIAHSQPIEALRILIDENFDLSSTQSTERENFINLFIAKLPRNLIPKLFTLKGMLFCNTNVEKLRLAVPHVMRINRAQSDMMTLFIKTYKHMTQATRFYSLQLLANDYITLRDQGVDLRNFRYENNKNLTQMLLQLPYGSAPLEFLERLDRPVRQVYLPSLAGAPHIEETHRIGNTPSLEID